MIGRPKGLKNSKPPHKYTEEEKSWLRLKYPELSKHPLAEQFNNTFGCEL